MPGISPLITKWADRSRKSIIPVVVMGVWAAQTGFDVKHATKENKKNVLINDLLIGSAMMVGGKLGHLGSRHFFQEVKPFTKDFIQTMGIPVGAGIAGGIAGEITQRIFPVKDDHVHEILEKAAISEDLGYGVLSKAYGYTGNGIGQSMNDSFETLVGLSVGKEKGVKNKIKKFIFEMAGGILFPFATVMILKRGFGEQLSKMNPKIEKGLTFGLSIGASFVGRAAITLFNKEVTEKIAKAEIWDTISQKQQELMRNSIFTQNPFQKKEILKQINDLTKIKEGIRKK